MAERAKSSEKRQRTELVAVRLYPDERARLEALAKAHGTQISTLLRESALKREGEALQLTGT